MYDDVVWIERKMQQIPGNEGNRFWISECGKYAKKGSFICGEWREVTYKLNKCCKEFENNNY